MSTNSDRSLGDDPTPTVTDPQAPSVFGNPNGVPAKAPMQFLTVDEVLTTGKRVRTHADICLRADLQAEYEDVLVELAGLVDAQGNVMPGPDGSLADSQVTRAHELAARAQDIKAEMGRAMRRVEFEGMPDAEWRPWHAQHYPAKTVKAAQDRGEDPDISDFNNLLIATVAVSPTLTVEEVKKLRSQLGSPQMTELANAAWTACTRGGVDVPKSPAFLRNLKLG